MSLNINEVFARCGLASLDDLDSPEWQLAFDGMNKVQQEISSASLHTAEYRWPRNPLQEATRPWEYPYVFLNLDRFFRDRRSPCPTLLDIGSGFTFYPYFLARHGFNVIAIDSDPVPGEIYQRAKGLIQHSPGQVEFRLASIHSLPFADNSIDGIYCISVIEHVHDLTGIVFDMCRVLKENGIAILTFDVDLEGNFDLSPSAWHKLRSEIDGSFSLLYPESTIHPMRLLTNQNHPYVHKKRTATMFPFATQVFRTNRKLILKSMGRASQLGFHVSSFGLCLTKKAN